MKVAMIVFILISSIAKYQDKAFTQADTALLIQAAMLVAGIGTLVQLYPIWKIGARLPIVMVLSFTFLGSAIHIASAITGF